MVVYSQRTWSNILALIKPLLVIYLLCFTGQSKAYVHTESHCGNRLHQDVATRKGDSLSGIVVVIRAASKMLCCKVDGSFSFLLLQNK